MKDMGVGIFILHYEHCFYMEHAIHLQVDGHTQAITLSEMVHPIHVCSMRCLKMGMRIFSLQMLKAGSG